MIQIKPIKKEQIPLLLSLIKEMAHYEKLDKDVTATEQSLCDAIFTKKVALCDLLYSDDNIAGYLMYFYNVSSFTGCPNLYVEDIYVKEQYRRQGIGKECFIYLARKAFKENVKRIDWICLNWNQKGLDFYASLGAKALDFWVLHRLDEEAIHQLAKEQ